MPSTIGNAMHLNKKAGLWIRLNRKFHKQKIATKPLFYDWIQNEHLKVSLNRCERKKALIKAIKESKTSTGSRFRLKKKSYEFKF